MISGRRARVNRAAKIAEPPLRDAHAIGKGYTHACRKAEHERGSMSNDFRARLRAKQTLLGTMVTLASSSAAEVLAGRGFDWLFIDAEHGALENADILRILQAVDERVACVVRVNAPLEVPIKQVLDLGAAGIVAPQDLKGKKLGVPFVSTTHFHTLFALEQFGIDPDSVKVLNMQPNAIAAAWERGDIDAAFVWDPALGRIKKTGKVLITSGQLCKWGKCTFDGMVANGTWSKAHPDFMVTFIKTIAAADEAYRSNMAAWTPDSAPVKKIVKLIGGNPADVPGVLALYNFPDLATQASSAWLGGGKDGGAVKAIYFTSAFLKQEKKIEKLLPDYTVAVNPTWVNKALGK